MPTRKQLKRQNKKVKARKSYEVKRNRKNNNQKYKKHGLSYHEVSKARFIMNSK